MIAEPQVFVDTNILIYAYDARAGSKHDTARNLLTSLWQSHRGVLSIQVLQEFYVTVTRKLIKPLDRLTARSVVMRYGSWRVFSPNPADLARASDIQERHQISFWDALIVHAASQMGADCIVSEDLQSGRRIEGVLIQNPFLS